MKEVKQCIDCFQVIDSLEDKCNYCLMVDELNIAKAKKILGTKFQGTYTYYVSLRLLPHQYAKLKEISLSKKIKLSRLIRKMIFHAVKDFE